MLPRPTPDVASPYARDLFFWKYTPHDTMSLMQIIPEPSPRIKKINETWPLNRVDWLIILILGPDVGTFTKKHTKVEWTPRCEAALQPLRTNLQIHPSWPFPIVVKKYMIYTDASHQTLSEVLGQEQVIILIKFTERLSKRVYRIVPTSMESSNAINSSFAARLTLRVGTQY